MAIPFRAPYPTQYVLGSTNPIASATFLTAFGMQPSRIEPVARETARVLYGHNQELMQIVMTPTGVVDPGTIRIIETPEAGITLEPSHVGFYGVDIYCRHLELGAEISRALQGSPGPIITYPVHPHDRWLITETQILSPERDYAVFLSESSRQAESVWPPDPSAAYSDLLNFVGFVNESDVALESEFWIGEVGLQADPAGDTWFDDEEIRKLMGLDQLMEMGCSVFCDADETRLLELLYYRGDVGRRRNHSSLRGGWHAVVVETPRIREAIETLSVPISEPQLLDTGQGLRYVSCGESPGGLRFELLGEPANPGDRTNVDLESKEAGQ